MTRIEENEKNLVRAFSNIIYPGDDKLLRTDGLDDSDISFLYAYKNKSWIDIDFNQLSRESSCLSALSDNGLKFVIPAYVRMFIYDQSDDNGWIDRLLFVLANKGRGFLSLTPEQFDVIEKKFLNPVKLLWDATQDSCFGDNLGDFVNAAKNAYR